MERAAPRAPGLLQLPPDTIARIAALTDSSRARASLKLACRALFQNSQQHASTWHPDVDIKPWHKLDDQAQQECVVSLLAFLARYRPQLHHLTLNTLNPLIRHLGAGVLKHCILPCCGQLRCLSLGSAAPPPLHMLSCLEELSLGWRMPPTWPPALSSLGLNLWEVVEEEEEEGEGDYVAHPLPPCIAELSSLRQLAVAGNAGFQHLPPALTYLEIDGEGQMAEELAHLTALRNLQELQLHPVSDEEQLEVELLDLPDLSGMTALRKLEVAGDIEWQVDCRRIPSWLTRLELGFVREVVAPSELRRLATLQELDLQQAGAAVLRALLPNLPPGLVALSMGYCTLPEVPVALPQLTALQRLEIYNSSMQPIGFERLPPTLTSVQLSRCSYLGEIPAALQQLTALQHLSLHNCRQLAAGYQHLPHTLTSLDLAGCYLTEVPAALQQLTALQELFLGSFYCVDCELCGGFEHLPHSLTRLVLPRCVPPVPPALQQLTALRELMLWGFGKAERPAASELPPGVKVNMC